MKSINILKIMIFISLLLLTSCGQKRIPVSKGGFYYSGIYFGTHLPELYKKGIKDGCTTSKGSYKKSHKLFKNEQAYNVGWFFGRNKCKKLLKLDHNGDLIL